MLLGSKQFDYSKKYGRNDNNERKNPWFRGLAAEKPGKNRNFESESGRIGTDNGKFGLEVTKNFMIWSSYFPNFHTIN